MTTVSVEPMPESYRQLAPRWRPGHPPIFPDDEPSRADRALALALWRALDLESRRWYVGDGRTFAGLPLTPGDLSGAE